MDPRDELLSLLPRLRRFARGLTGSATIADDLVQETCLRALERWHRWTPGTSLSSWTFKIMHNLWIDDRRRTARRPTVSDSVLAERADEIDPTAMFEARDAMKVIEKGIAALPEEQRAVLLLVTFEDLSYAEAARVLEIPIGTVMSRVSRARQKLLGAVEGPEEQST